MDRGFKIGHNHGIARFFWSILLASAAAYLGLYLAVTWGIDPLMENNRARSSLNRRRFRHSWISVKTLFDELRGETRCVLVFGTSQIRLVSAEMLGRPVLNFDALFINPKAQRHPGRILELLRQLDARQRANVERIYLQLDPLIFNDERGERERIDWNSSAGLSRRSLESFNIDKVMEAAKTVLKNLSGRYSFYYDERGHRVELEDLNARRGLVAHQPSGDIDRRVFLAGSVAVLGQIDAWSRRHGIPIVYFEMPRSDFYLRQLDYGALAALRRAILGRIDCFYDLAYLEGVSDDHALFYDDHLNARGTEKVFREILIPENSRYRVCAANVERHLAALERRLGPGRHGL